jgi:hypothetical protein
LRDEKIPKGMFLMEKWLPLDTEIYDIVLENGMIENVCRMMMCSGLSVFIQEVWSSGDHHVIRLGEGFALIVRSNLVNLAVDQTAQNGRRYENDHFCVKSSRKRQVFWAQNHAERVENVYKRTVF